MMKMAHKERRIYGLLSSWTPLRNPAMDKMLRLVGILFIVSILIIPLTRSAYAWPSSWITYTKGGDALWDPDDESPKGVDLRGDSSNPAGFYGQDSSGLYFRQRVDGNPSGPGMFAQYVWSVLIESDGDPATYDWLLAIDGGVEEQVELWQNTVKSNSPTDSAESEKWSDSTGTYARIVAATSTFDGDSDYYVDWYVPWSTFTSQTGLNENSTIRLFFGTSTNHKNINKDLQAGDPGTLSDGFGDQVTPSGAPPIVLGVKVTAPSGKAASPGESINYDFTVTNTGNTSDTYILTAESQNGWSVGAPSSVTVSAGGSETVAVTVTVPTGASGGSTDDLTLTATSQTDLTIVNSDTTTTTVRLVSGVEVIAPAGQSVNSGESVSYDFAVTNAGNTSDTYSLTASSPHGWSVSAPSSVTVSAGAGETVTVMVSVPSDAIAGTADHLTLTATSQTDTSIAYTATTTTTVVAVPERDVEVIAPVGQTAYPGDSVSYDFLVRNPGEVYNTYSLTAYSPHGWSVSTPSSVTVSAGASETVTVTVSVPADAIAGTADHLLLTASCTVDNCVVDSGAATTTIVGAVPTQDVEVIAPAGKTANPGDSISYDFTVTNTGNISDTYSLSAASPHDLRGWSVSSPSSVAVSAGDSEIVAVTVNVPPDAPVTTVDRVSLTASSQTNPAVADSDTTSTTVVAVPERDVEVIAPAGKTAHPGESVSYEFVVSNRGSTSDTYVLTVYSAHGWFVSDPWSVSLPANTSERVPVTVTVPSSATVGTTDYLILAATSQTDSAVNDSNTTITTVIGAIMSINKTDGVGLADVGSKLVYTITYENTGNSESKAEITDVLPEGLSYDPDYPASPLPDEIQGQKLIWSDSISPVAANSGHLTITIPVKVDLDVEDGTIITNQAILDYEDLYGNPQTQEIREDITVIRAPRLALIKEVSKTRAERGDILVYYVTIQNNGGGTCFEVKVSDTLPRGISYLKGSATLNGAPIDDPTGINPFTWSIPDLTGSSSTVLRYKVIVGMNAPYAAVKNEAEFTSSNAPSVGAVSTVTIVEGEGPLVQKGTVEGVIFEDIDASEKRNSGEPGLPSVEVRLDGFRATRTGDDGSYKFLEVERGRHVVSLDPRTLAEGYFLTGSSSKFVDNLAPGQTKRVHFAVRSLPGKIVGMVFLDLERDETREPDADGVSGIRVILNDKISTETNENGRFEFDRLALGEYRVRLDTKKLGKSYRFTTDILVQISLSAEEKITSVDFGLYPRPYLRIEFK